MAAKTLHMPGWGDYKYDDKSETELLSAGRMQCEHTPTADHDVLRLEDFAGDLQTKVVADIDDPSSELASLSGPRGGALLVVYEVSDPDQQTIYAWDASASAADIPYVVAGDGGYWVAVAGRYSNGPVSIQEQLSVVGGTLDSLNKVLDVSAILDSSAGAENIGCLLDLTSAGSEAQTQRGVKLLLGAGYTGANQNAALHVDNQAASLGQSFTSSSMTAATGVSGLSSGSKAGASRINVGVYGNASQSDYNVGLGGLVIDGGNARTNVAVRGRVKATGTSAIGYGGLFECEGVTDGAALAADNLSSNDAILQCFDNGILVFEVDDAYSIYVGKHPTAVTLEVDNTLYVGTLNSDHRGRATFYNNGSDINDYGIYFNTGVDRAGLYHNPNTNDFILFSEYDLYLKSTGANNTLVLSVMEGAAERTIIYDGADNKLKSSVGLFDFDDDNIVTTGTLTTGNGFGMNSVSAQAQQAHIVDGLQVTSADATDLATAITLANEIKSDYNDLRGKFNTLLADSEGFGFHAAA